jgi:hypothetical protein
MGEDSGVECLRDCAIEQGRRPRERKVAGEYRGGRAEKVGMEFCFCVKTHRDGARRDARRIRTWESRFMRQK